MVGLWQDGGGPAMVFALNFIIPMGVIPMGSQIKKNGSWLWSVHVVTVANPSRNPKF